MTNGGSQPATLDTITIDEWAPANGNLKKVKLGTTIVWTGNEAPPAAGSPLVLALSGGGRNLALGERKTLRLIFDNVALDGPYGLELGFVAGAASSDVQVDQEGTPGVCGDGALDPGEECDDGTSDPGEACDDGNNVDGDRLRLA